MKKKSNAGAKPHSKSGRAKIQICYRIDPECYDFLSANGKTALLERLVRNEMGKANESIKV